ncbi:MAG: 50S ribosomal protein L11 methyltransferase [Deltaproteobacteria bacterium]|nr:50S ribosomal protein L11 methyltransferase [Deltaproteobacteria bacterium]
MGDEYRRFWLTSSTPERREWLLAEAFEAGAEGAEEKDEAASGGSPVRHRACIYARAEVIEDVRGAVLAAIAAGAGDAARGSTDSTSTSAEAAAEVGPAEALPAVDWSEEWKRGLGPIVISDRLVVRPPFSPFACRPGQREIVIDPGQAFGTGTHASTHLCLEWIDALLAEADGPARFARMLDVGTGSGVLALAAVVRGAREAVGFDLDPVAIEAAEEAARANGLAAGVRFACGPIEAIDGAPFELVVANLLKRELLPIAGAIAARLATEGSLILAGLLEEDGDEVAACFAPFGLVERERRVREDPVGRWIAPRYVRGAAGASPSRRSQSA